MDYAYFRFCNGDSFIPSRIIEATTRCDWSHVEIMHDDLQSTFGAQLSGGVRWRETSDKCYKKLRAYQIIRVPLTSEQFIRGVHFIQETTGKPYDWRGIIAFGLGNRDWTEPDSWWCSEWSMMFKVRMGLILLPEKIPVTRITPRDDYWATSQLRDAELFKEWRK